MKLSSAFYRNSDTVGLARSLIGKTLATHLPLYPDRPGSRRVLTSVRITETEAYVAPLDKASHAFGNLRTRRTESMFAAGGIAYIYLCYGMHHLFNVVTGPEDVPHAILIRAGWPVTGLEHMRARALDAASAAGDRSGSRKPRPGQAISADGPGRLTRLLGIRTLHNGLTLCGDRIWLEDSGREIEEDAVLSLPRVGVAYAGEYAERPWRFKLINQKNSK